MSIKSVDLGDMKTNIIDKKNNFQAKESHLELLNDVEIIVEARIGSTQISVNELFSLKKGDTIKLEQLVSSPVELVLNQKTIAIGELVAVGEYFAVQITEIK